MTDLVHRGSGIEDRGGPRRRPDAQVPTVGPVDDHTHAPADELRALAASYDVPDVDPDVDAEMVPLTDRTAAPGAGPQPRREGAPWWTHARCNDGRGRLTDLFFSPEPRDIARAKRLCLRCTALIPCLEGALERREPWGVWGGQLFVEGTIVATKRRRGRPPKRPRPEDQQPEVPLPQHLRGVPVVRIA
jgi:WhiB family transcriptional regulator, redox-sensing transcriptional regulator